MEEAVNIIKKHYGIENPFLRTRKKEYCECRFMMWYYFRFTSSRKYKVRELSKLFQLDHTTIVDGVKRFKNLLETEPSLRMKQIEIENEIRLTLNRKRRAEREIYRKGQEIHSQELQPCE